MPDPQNKTWKLGDWTLTQRPVREDDGPGWFELVRAMSHVTRYKRGSRRPEQIGPDDIRRAVTPDPGNEIVLIVEASRAAETKMIAVARAKRRRTDTWELGIVVLDEWQGRGIGVTLVQALMDALAARDAAAIEADILATNRSMIEFLERLGFEAQPHPTRAHVTLAVRKLTKTA